MKEHELKDMDFNEVLSYINDLEADKAELEEKVSDLEIEISEHREDGPLEDR